MSALKKCQILEHFGFCIFRLAILDLYVCVYIFMCICMCMYEACVCVHMYMLVHVCMYMCTCLHMCTCIWHMCVHMFVSVCICACVCVCMYEVSKPTPSLVGRSDPLVLSAWPFVLPLLAACSAVSPAGSASCLGLWGSRGGDSEWSATGPRTAS